MVTVNDIFKGGSSKGGNTLHLASMLVYMNDILWLPFIRAFSTPYTCENERCSICFTNYYFFHYTFLKV